MGDSVTKIGEAKISSKGHVILISAAKPWLDNPKPGDYIEFHVEDGEVKIRKKKESKG